MAQERSWYEVVQECQARVVRIRAVLTTGGALTPELQSDLDAVILAMRNWLIGRVRQYGLDLIKIYFDFRNAFCVSIEFGSYAARNMFP